MRMQKRSSGRILEFPESSGVRESAKNAIPRRQKSLKNERSTRHARFSKRKWPERFCKKWKSEVVSSAVERRKFLKVNWCNH